jgi:hypothetical protein
VVHIQRSICGPLIQYKKSMKTVWKTENLQSDYSKKLFYQKSKVHQVFPKNAGSRKISFLASKEEVVGVSQIPSHDRRIFFC